MKSRFRVLPLRLAPLNYTVRSPLNFAPRGRGSVRFFWFAVFCAQLWVGRSLDRIIAAIAGTSGESTSYYMVSVAIDRYLRHNYRSFGFASG